MKIAIVKLSALGDIVHASVVLQLIKAHIPNAKISWFVDAKFAQILSDHPLIEEVVALPLKEKKIKESFEILREKKERNFDIAIDLQGLIKSGIVTRFLSQNAVGFDKNSIRERLAAKFYQKKFQIPYEKNVILRNCELVSRALGFKFSEDEILGKLPCFPAGRGKIQLEKAKKNVLLVVGASVKTKIYPIQKQAELAQKLRNLGAEVYLSFGKNETEMAEFIAQNSDAKLMSGLNLSELKDQICEFDLVIGGDTGPTHLAWAQNVPSIAIFGYTPHYRNAYITPKNLVIHTGIAIDAWNLDKNNDCIAEISVDEILKLAERLL